MGQKKISNQSPPYLLHFCVPSSLPLLSSYVAVSLFLIITSCRLISSFHLLIIFLPLIPSFLLFPSFFLLSSYSAPINKHLADPNIKLQHQTSTSKSISMTKSTALQSFSSSTFTLTYCIQMFKQTYRDTIRQSDSHIIIQHTHTVHTLIQSVSPSSLLLPI